MTLDISAIYPDAIIMSVDRMLTVESGNRRIGQGEQFIKKYYQVDAGCITAWGKLDSIKVIFDNFLRQSLPCNVIDLNDDLYHWLRYEFKPKALQWDDVGFHVGGYDVDGKVHLFHTLWGRSHRNGILAEHQDYHKGQHEPGEIVYNGKYFEAGAVVHFLNQFAKEKQLRNFVGQGASVDESELHSYLLQSSPILNAGERNAYARAIAGYLKHVIQDKELAGLLDSLISEYNIITAIQFHDSLIQYVASLRDDVGGTISTSVILPDNRVLTINNSTKCALPSYVVRNWLDERKDNKSPHIERHFNTSVVNQLTIQTKGFVYEFPHVSVTPVSESIYDMWSPGTADYIHSAVPIDPLPLDGGTATDFAANGTVSTIDFWRFSDDAPPGKDVW